MKVEGVGRFRQGSGFWEAEPENLGGSLLSIESPTINASHAARAKSICEDWVAILEVCYQFIESHRDEYDLCAQTFENPNVFIEEEDIWSVYFDTEVDAQAIVGVEFHGQFPFQLIVGD